MVCKNCGNQVADDLKVCPTCGANLEEAAPAAEKKGCANLNGQDKIVMALLAILLPYGIHNFMMGETKKGIVKIVGIFVCGIGPILSLIEGIMILMDKYQADPEKLFF
ncbi:MAG: TM2 domain-containing protein [Clostridia bacterium]|nr:TM2 domain-containing protein [Clostridia bacterium]